MPEILLTCHKTLFNQSINQLINQSLKLFMSGLCYLRYRRYKFHICLNNTLKCTVSVHEIFTGKKGHLYVNQSEKELKFNGFFSTFHFLQNKMLKNYIFDNKFCEKNHEF